MEQQNMLVVNLSVAVQSVKRVLDFLPGLIAECIHLARADVLRHQAENETQYSHLTVGWLLLSE